MGVPVACLTASIHRNLCHGGVCVSEAALGFLGRHLSSQGTELKAGIKKASKSYTTRFGAGIPSQQVFLPAGGGMLLGR